MSKRSQKKGIKSDRNPDGTFKKGHSVKKPKGVRHMSTLLREYITKELADGSTYGDGITKRVIKAAIEGEPWAVKIVYEYIDGKPRQTVDVNQVNTDIPIEEQQAMREAIRNLI